MSSSTVHAVNPPRAKDLPAKDVRPRFEEVRNTSLRLAESLTAEDQMLQSMPDASPVKWHLAHTTWFFETFLLRPSPDYKLFDDRFTWLFNSYYKQLGSHPYRGSRGLMSRPALEEVRAYRRHVDEAMLRMLESEAVPVKPGNLELIELGLNHEQQHQELIVTDIKHGLWSSPLRPEYRRTPPSSAQAPPLNWIDVEGGIHSIGHAGDGFAFDNESPRHEVLVRPFRIASRGVTNREYMSFMEGRGYQRPELWLSDGWDTVNAQHWNAPLYWEQRDGQWFHYTLGGARQVDPDEPVCHISFYEADAFARWSGARLPTEEEWEISASRVSAKGTFLDDGVFHPQAARSSPQFFGDVWEWTASPYLAYPGFRPAEGAVGEYNGKFMCNQFVLRGGSCATPAGHIRATYRNFFPPHARWQFSGLRLAHDCP